MPRKSSSANAPKRSDSNVRRTIGANVRARRLTLGWSQQELADRFGVSRATVSQYEIGTGEVNAGDLPRLAEILGAGILDLYGIPPAVTPPPPERAGEAQASDGRPPGDEFVPRGVRTRVGDGVIRLVDVATGRLEYVGAVEDPGQFSVVSRLLVAILGLSADDRETVGRVVKAMRKVPNQST